MEALWPSSCGGCGRLGGGRLCADCRRRDITRLPVVVEGLRGCWVLAPYDGAIGQAVKHAKAHADSGLAQAVAELFAIRLAPVVVAGAFDLIVPAPSTLWSRFSRGFSLAAVMAHELALRTQVPVVHTLRRRSGRRQVGLDRAARRANLAGRMRADTAITGRVLLLDDVLTTGATADAGVRELLGSGATEVWLAVICRANTARPRLDRSTLAAAAW